MYKNVLQNIEHIEIWPVISFVIFFLFFLGLLLWVFTTDKKFIDKMKHLPIDDSMSPSAGGTSTKKIDTK